MKQGKFALWVRASTVERGQALSAEYRSVRHRLTSIAGNSEYEFPASFVGPKLPIGSIPVIGFEFSEGVQNSV